MCAAAVTPVELPADRRTGACLPVLSAGLRRRHRRPWTSSHAHASLITLGSHLIQAPSGDQERRIRLPGMRPLLTFLIHWPARLVPGASDHGQRRVARVGRIGRRSLAQAEDRAPLRLDQPGVAAHSAQAGLRPRPCHGASIRHARSVAVRPPASMVSIGSGRHGPPAVARRRRLRCRRRT